MRPTRDAHSLSRLTALVLVALVAVVIAGCAATRPTSGTGAALPTPAPLPRSEAGQDTASPPAPPAAIGPDEGTTPSEEAVVVDDETTGSDDEGEEGEEADQEPHEESPLDELAETPPPELTPEEIQKERSLVEAAKPTFDIPISYNEKVLGWVDRYSGGMHDRFLPGLIRSGRYLPMIRRIFQEEGLPQDLAYMAHVESAYKPNAYSRARAKGIFQFIAGTGRRYGLRTDYWVDERSDPEMATRAAAAYLKDLYAMFGDWYLAMAAYNAGEGKIQRGLAITGAKDFWALAMTRYIRTETKNYVPAILAAALISKDPSAYGFEFTPDDPTVYDSVEVEGAVDLRVLARCAGTDAQTLHELNPSLRRMQTPPEGRTHVRVPVGTGDVMLAELAKIPTGERILYARHVVRRGDTLGGIARRYGSSISGIQRANHMKGTVLTVGRVLKIPNSASAAMALASDREVEPEATPAPSGRRTTGSHSSGDILVVRVRRGDTLSSISRRYGTTVEAIAAVNGISRNHVIKIGERLRVAPGAKTAAVARRRAAAPGKPRAAAASPAAIHTVRSGETLWAIAGRYNVSVTELCSMNDLAQDSPLTPGMRLTVRRH